MAKLKFNKINKNYDNNHIVKDFSLDVKDGEFIVLLGPSGCGKSTILRMLAGLENISSGDILIADKQVNDLPPRKRNIAMVFQSYALYPHMTVYDNIAYGLKVNKKSKEEIEKKVSWAANILEITQYLQRKPRDLSGGQRQRVAMGRAMVRTPDVFLFDEPLSNLDAKLRSQMRQEIKDLHNKLTTTTIYVTHDQIEALTLADRIVILHKGGISQVGTPKEIFNQPKNIFVASFIGSPAMNLLKGTVISKNNKTELLIENQKLLLDQKKFQTLIEGQKVTLGIRPDDIVTHLGNSDCNGEFTLTSKVKSTELLGSTIQVNSSIGKLHLTSEIQSDSNLKVGENITLKIDINKYHLFDTSTGLSLKLD